MRIGPGPATGAFGKDGGWHASLIDEDFKFGASSYQALKKLLNHRMGCVFMHEEVCSPLCGAHALESGNNDVGGPTSTFVESGKAETIVRPKRPYIPFKRGFGMVGNIAM